MSLLVTTLLVGCGVLVGRFIAKGSPPEPPKEEQPEMKPEPPAEATKPARVELPSFPCQLGDVVLRSAGDEAWLAGALILHEGDAPAAALFVSPEAKADRAVLARPSQSELLWLSEEKGVVIALGDPPTALEIGSERYERRRRLPLRAERVGTGAPDLGPDVIFAEYTGLGDDHLVVLATKDRVLAYRGPALGSGAYDVLPGKE